MFSLHLVKTRKIEKEWSDIFSVQREDREIGDYDFDIPIDKDRAANVSTTPGDSFRESKNSSRNKSSVGWALSPCGI